MVLRLRGSLPLRAEFPAVFPGEKAIALGISQVADAIAVRLVGLTGR